jgi:glycosyltransferase involved in cell wall biosynthesis
MLGPEAVLLQLAAALPEFGYEVIVGSIHGNAARPPALVDVLRGAGVPCVDIISPRGASISAIRELRRHVRHAQYDLVHAHGYREDFFARLVMPRARLVATNHLWKGTTWQLKVYEALDARLLRGFPVVVAVSQEIAREMVRVGVPAGAITVIPNGIAVPPWDEDRRALARHRLRNELLLGPDVPLVMMVSSITPEKGHATALAAFAQLGAEFADAHLVIVGDGPLQDTLTRRAETLGISPRVHFTGRRTDVPTLLAGADLFLMSSLSEGLPMALLEGMAAGLPSVATAVGEIPYVLTDDVGYVVPPNDAGALANKLSALLRSPEQRRTMGSAARARIASTYSARRMAQRYAEVYDAVLGRAAR